MGTGAGYGAAHGLAGCGRSAVGEDGGEVWWAVWDSNPGPTG